MMMDGAKACVKYIMIWQTTLKLIGNKQGEGLFNTALEHAIRQLSVDVNSWLIYKSGQIIGCADGINIMGRSTPTV